jgi:hypothetical protein
MLKKETVIIKLLIFSFILILFFLFGFNEITKNEIFSQDFSIKNLMNASEFNNCGLNKLNSKELENLNNWLFSFMLSVITNSNNSGDVIESSIDGDFEGWDGDTIFKLTNGQIWEQVSYDYEYHYAFMPEVTIIRTRNNRYKMMVEGMSGSIYVERIK